MNKSNQAETSSQNNSQALQQKPVTKKYFYLEDLLALPQEEIPMLVDSLVEAQGIAFLAGGSDTGKSLLGMQLAIAVANGESSFLGLPMKTKHSKAIMLFTEDFHVQLKIRAKGILNGRTVPAKQLRIDHVQGKNLANVVRQYLTDDPADFVFIDTFRDVFRAGDLNNSIAISECLEPFKKIARDFDCMIMFVHHITKVSEAINQPNKNNLLGSEAIQSAARSVLYLQKRGDGKRMLTMVKGNNFSDDCKKQSLELDLTLPGGYQFSGSKVAVKATPVKNNDKVIAQVKELTNQGFSVRDIVKELKNGGTEISKSSVSTIIQDLKKCPTVQIPIKSKVGQQVKKAA